MSAAITTLGRLGLGASGTEDPVTSRLDFIDFDLGVEDELRDLNGTRGKYAKDDARVRKNLTRVLPRLRCQPTAVELSHILPWVLNGTPTGTGTLTYPLADSVALRSVHFDPNGGNLWKLPNVAVDVATFRCREGEPLEVELECVGQSYSVAGSFPAVALDLSTKPFLMVDCVLTVGGSAVQFREFALSVRKGINRERFFNSATLTGQFQLARSIGWSLSVPFGDNATIYNTAVSAGAAVVATFTNGGSILTFTSNAVRVRPRSPISPFQQEVMQPLEGEAYSSDGTAEALVTTLANGP